MPEVPQVGLVNVNASLEQNFHLAVPQKEQIQITGALALPNTHTFILVAWKKDGIFSSTRYVEALCATHDFGALKKPRKDDWAILKANIYGGYYEVFNIKRDDHKESKAAFEMYARKQTFTPAGQTAPQTATPVDDSKIVQPPIQDAELDNSKIALPTQKVEPAPPAETATPVDSKIVQPPTQKVEPAPAETATPVDDSKIVQPPTQKVASLIGKTIQLASAYWVNRGDDGRVYAASFQGPNSNTRNVIMSKPLGQLTSTKGNWIVKAVPGEPDQIQLASAYWVNRGEDGRMYAANFRGPNSKTQNVIMSKPIGQLTSTKGNWIVRFVD